MTKAADQRATKLAAILREKERLIEDAHPALLSMPLEYIEAIAAVRHLAYHGQTSDQVGSRGSQSSRAPKHDARMGKVLDDEYKALQRRAKGLRSHLSPGAEAWRG